ncbi:phytosulfokines 3-like [Melia azedarach]|uniref:Phytosulfokines 3-like n=1 Tax=Melia azedarach TaxID=155640 RepID=A0ACC1XI59_MELAZ|nr:phytosulfokines 3-like [Melia azedarach]
MSKSLSFFFILALFLLSTTECRLILNTTRKQYKSADAPVSSNPTVSAPEVSISIDGDDCSGLGSEECLLRKSMVAHTDYIYTQHINGP